MWKWPLKELFCICDRFYSVKNNSIPSPRVPSFWDNFSFHTTDIGFAHVSGFIQWNVNGWDMWLLSKRVKTERLCHLSNFLCFKAYPSRGYAFSPGLRWKQCGAELVYQPVIDKEAWKEMSLSYCKPHGYWGELLLQYDFA